MSSLSRPIRVAQLGFPSPLALALCLCLPAGARANGAFPDSLRLFAPADRPTELILATNFGLVMSRDDGATWDWVCEHGEGDLATQYQVAAPGSRRLFAVAPDGLVYSDDDACSWAATADLTSTTVTDAFADPVNPDRVLALGSFIDPGGQPKSGLFISLDAGKTFGAPRYLAPAEAPLYSVEVAASRAARLYLTTYRSTPAPPGAAVLRSDDGGATWTSTDVRAVTGDGVVRIAAIDPADPQKVYFRVTGTQDAIGLTTDGGATLTLPLVVTTQLTGFLRRANGQLLVSALDLVDGALYRSMDAGRTFSRMATRLSIRALAERAGKLYVATDNVLDGFAVAVSADDGLTFQPVMRFDQVKGARACGGGAAMCAASCANLVRVGTFKAASCAAGATADTDGGGQPGPADGAGGGAPPPPGKGCGCRAPPAGDPSLSALLMLAAAVALARSRAR